MDLRSAVSHSGMLILACLWEGKEDKAKLLTKALNLMGLVSHLAWPKSALEPTIFSQFKEQIQPNDIKHVEVLGCCSFRKDTGCYTWLGVESTFRFRHPLGGRPRKGWVLPVCTQGSQTHPRRGRRHPGEAEP